MATRTVDETRAQAVVRRIARLDADPARREAVALGLVDALLDGDAASLSAVLDALRDARARAGAEELAGWLDAAIAFAHWGLERVPSQPAVAAGTQAHAFLSALAASQLGSTELGRALGVDETQVSRTGRRLLETGLVTRRKVGRQVFWQLTPRGRRALEEAPVPQPSRGSDYWQEALRRGFDGDVEPETDPVRAKIVEHTLALHLSLGIRATTPADVAKASGAPLETVEAMFPTVDDAVATCGAHFFETLRLPPRDRAAEAFAGAASEHERIHRLVETLFRVYEQGADGITAARRERNDVPALQESMGALDMTFDALVAEAIPDTASVASVRALTDIEVWRALRHRGAAPEAAVDEASATVEGWLRSHAA